MTTINSKQVETVHINQINAGDVIIHNGIEMTVTPKDIKEDGFMGKSVFGDSYRLGYLPVLKVKN